MNLTFDFYDGSRKTVGINVERLARFRVELEWGHQANRMYWVATDGVCPGKDVPVSRLLEAVEQHQVVERYETDVQRADEK